MRTTPGGSALTCDLGALTAPDLAVVDALARLRLAAARHGVGVVLLNAGGPLRELLAFSGLAALLPGASEPPDVAELLGPAELLGDGLLATGLPDAGLLASGPPPGLPGVQPERQAEEREEHVGVEEVGEPGDPAG